MGLDEVFDERPEKIPQSRMIQAGFVGPPAVNIDFRDLLEACQMLRIIDILELAIIRHAARLRLGNDFGEKIEHDIDRGMPLRQLRHPARSWMQSQLQFVE